MANILTVVFKSPALMVFVTEVYKTVDIVDPGTPSYGIPDASVVGGLEDVTPEEGNIFLCNEKVIKKILLI